MLPGQRARDEALYSFHVYKYDQCSTFVCLCVLETATVALTQSGLLGWCRLIAPLSSLSQLVSLPWRGCNEDVEGELGSKHNKFKL